MDTETKREQKTSYTWAWLVASLAFVIAAIAAFLNDNTTLGIGAVALAFVMFALSRTNPYTWK